jgi:hypothetical protein
MGLLKGSFGRPRNKDCQNREIGARQCRPWFARDAYFCKKGLKTVNHSASLGDYVCQHVDVDLHALEDVVVLDEVDEPGLDLSKC